MEQKIIYFSAEGPWNIEFLAAIDPLRLRTESIDETPYVNEAYEAFKRAFGANDQIHFVKLPFGSHGLYDAIFTAIDKLDGVTNPRKAVVSVADGFDDMAGDPGAQLIEHGKKYNIPVYAMFLGRAIAALAVHDFSGTQFRQVADITGGLYLSTDTLEMRRALVDLAAELQSKYVIGFMSTNDAKDNKYRKLKVNLRPLPEGTRVTAKPQYFVPKTK